MKVLTVSNNYRNRYNFSLEYIRDFVHRGHDVRLVGPGYEEYPKDVLDMTLNEHYDVLIVHHPQYTHELKNITKFKGMRVATIVDYFPRNWEWKTAWVDDNEFDIVFFSEQWMVDEFSKRSRGKARTFHLPHSVNTEVFYSTDCDRNLDFSFVASLNDHEYPGRTRVFKELQRLCGLGTFTGVTVGRRHIPDGIDKDTYIAVLRRSKVGVCTLDNQLSMSLRHLELMACGVRVLSPESPELNLVGLSSHYHRYDPRILNKLPIAIQSAMVEVDEANAAMEYVREFHSTEVRAKQFWEMVCR